MSSNYKELRLENKSVNNDESMILFKTIYQKNRNEKAFHPYKKRKLKPKN